MEFNYRLEICEDGRVGFVPVTVAEIIDRLSPCPDASADWLNMHLGLAYRTHALDLDPIRPFYHRPLAVDEGAMFRIITEPVIRG